jgi:hypothetical protein
LPATRHRVPSANDRDRATPPLQYAPAPVSHGARRQRKRRRSPVLPVAIIAVVAVTSAVATGYYRGSWRHEGGFSAAYEALPKSQAIAVLEAKHQEIVDLTAADQTMSTSDTPRLVSPAKVMATAKAKAEAAVEAAQEAKQEQQEQQEEQEEQQQQSDSSSTSTSTTTTPTDTSGELSPSEAQAEAKVLMPSYGFSVSSQFTCLDDLWNNESGWEWDAENSASGAFGIPQALPASKMASAGSDYMTDATTQMKWGLGYIESTYGSPCAAWDFEEENGFY